MATKTIQVCDLSGLEITAENPAVLTITTGKGSEILLDGKPHQELILSREGLLRALNLPEYSKLKQMIDYWKVVNDPYKDRDPRDW
jgi:hypothetical protein